MANRPRKSEVLLTLGAFLYFLLLATPDFTWVNTDSDSFIYLRSAESLVVSHATGAPLFNLLSWLFVKLPGPSPWNLALISVLASTVTTWLIFKATMRLTDDLKSSLLAAGVWLASGLVVSQSTIIETYALVTLTMVGAYTAYLYRHYTLAALALMVGVGIHHLIGLVIIPLLFTEMFRGPERWKRLGIAGLGLLPYLYVPLANRPPYFWIGPNSIEAFWQYFFSQGILFMGLFPFSQDGAERAWEATMLVLGNFTLALILLPLAFRKAPRLLWILAAVPFFYYATNLAPQTYVYLMPTVAFVAILAGIGASRCTKELRRVVAFGCLFLIALNVQLYDIGRTLDPAPTSARQFYDQLQTLPPNSVLITRWGWEMAAVFYARPDVMAVNEIHFYKKPWYAEPAQARLEEAMRNHGPVFETRFLEEQRYRSEIVALSW